MECGSPSRKTLGVSGRDGERLWWSHPCIDSVQRRWETAVWDLGTGAYGREGLDVASVESGWCSGLAEDSAGNRSFRKQRRGSRFGCGEALVGQSVSGVD